MMKRAAFLIVVVGLWGGKTAHALSFSPFSSDSTGTETKNGQTYVLHKVEPGQTLYAVMRKYKTSIQALKAANPGMKDNLIVGQIVRVPSQGRATNAPPQKVAAKEPDPSAEKDKLVLDYEIKPKSETPAKTEGEKSETFKIENTKVEETPKVTEVPAATKEKEPETTSTASTDTKPVAPAAPKSGLHRVEGGQSLYGIAVKHGVLMADIRRWNGLTSDQLRSGQELIVSDQAYQEYLKKNKLDSVKLADARKANTEKPATPVPVPVRGEDPTNSNLPEPKIANTGKRILETGVAEVLEGLENSNKYLALHRTAPVGSLIQVKNMNNSQSVWVKVIGKLPDISANNRIIIKLSARAQEKLSPGGKQFIAELSYLSQ
ncbi:LysM peptidoglycan-binding domain-containing protein [Runella sp. MFBS21]|uniref:LysM peptidoglycan-binding domain-containing protein n=1 Tax=Runella sp. MFBS21 TaxID=3034018 RepID=UPI0023F95FBF|nr:LysM peptidoglycan-binding domain-containing protein [Runella sp. MFBS21]MDF7821523.1 LysM peptidoglycan-binding domain-containing protein [Runella sp. MFBS21]